MTTLFAELTGLNAQRDPQGDDSFRLQPSELLHRVIWQVITNS